MGAGIGLCVGITVGIDEGDGLGMIDGLTLGG